MRQLIQFTRNGCNTLLGNFGPGDRLRCAPDMARHFVEQVGCAKYLSEPQAPELQPAAVQTPAKAPARQRKAKRVNPPTQQALEQ